MIPHKQTILHDPEIGQWGDCFRTAIACIMNIPDPTEVPHFCEGENPDWKKDSEAWLNDRGYTLVESGFLSEDATLEEVLAQFARNPCWYLVSGSSPRGNHCVIAQRDQLVHDPHPADTFLVGPNSNGHWFVNFLVPLTHAPTAWLAKQTDADNY